MKDNKKNSPKLKRIFCIVLSVLLIINIFFVTKFAFSYNLCYIPKEYKELTDLNDDQTPLFAAIYRWSLNPHSIDIYYYDYPFISVDTYILGKEGSNNWHLYSNIYNNTQLNIIVFLYDILCFVILVILLIYLIDQDDKLNS